MENKKTITSIFMLPTLRIDKNDLQQNGFVNAYIKDENREIQYEDCIYVLFKPDNLDKFKLFLDKEYERTETIIDDYDYEGGLVVLVYQLNHKYTNDFNLIKQGKYSQTSNEFQELFPKVLKIVKNGLYKDELSLQYRIFNKTSELKEYWENKIGINFNDKMEVWRTFDEKDEILTTDKIKEYVQSTTTTP